jgi:ribosomal protein S27E
MNTEWNIGRCKSCGEWVVFDRACSACSTITARPKKGDAEMQTTINGGNAIKVLDGGEIGAR